jgi:hypothetical protein
MTQLLNGLILLILVMLAFAAYSAVLHALFTDRIEAARAAMGATPLRAFVIGFNVLFFGLALLALMASSAERAPLVWLPALALTSILLVAASAGLSAFSQQVGEKLQTQAGPLRQHVAGALLLFWGCVLPGVGWFLLLPYLLCMSVGACLLTLRRARNF